MLPTRGRQPDIKSGRDELGAVSPDVCWSVDVAKREPKYQQQGKKNPDAQALVIAMQHSLEALPNIAFSTYPGQVIMGRLTETQGHRVGLLRASPDCKNFSEGRRGGSSYSLCRPELIMASQTHLGGVCSAF